MVHCAAYGCTNGSDRRGRDKYPGQQRFFSFPSDKKLKEAWVSAMKRDTMDDDGKVKRFVPSKHSVLCIRHFEDSSFDKPPSLLKDYGLAIRNNLRPDAVPTIFPEVYSEVKAKKESDFGPPKTKRTEYGAYRKRNQKRVSVYPTHFLNIALPSLWVCFFSFSDHDMQQELFSFCLYYDMDN